jgi:hypothetical protein
MVILGLGTLCGLVAGRARGGRLAALAALRFHAPLLLVAGALVQAGAGALSPDHRMPAIGVAYAVVGLWLVLNAHEHRGRVRVALALLGVGWCLNMVPVMLNGGMPVSRDGLERVGAPTSTSVSEGHLFKHVPADRHTRLAPLGDVIPVPVAASVISAGDVVLMAGLALVVAAGMTGRTTDAPRAASPDRLRSGRPGRTSRGSLDVLS